MYAVISQIVSRTNNTDICSMFNIRVNREITIWSYYLTNIATSF